MPRYFIQLSYNGVNYNGWQVQQNTQNTLQHILQEKLSIIFAQPIEVVGCGRTDAGVSAKEYYAHFDAQKEDLHLPETNYIYKLNKILPYEIAISKIYLVTSIANARFDAETRTYDYLVHTYKNPFLNQGSLYIHGTINFELMNAAATHLLSITDFTSFSKLNTQTKTNNCNVSFAQWIQLTDTEYVFRITANRFLRNMVRSIVGTLLEVGKQKITLNEFKTIIENKNRSDAGMSVSAHALYLTQITYPKTIFSNEAN